MAATTKKSNKSKKDEKSNGSTKKAAKKLNESKTSKDQSKEIVKVFGEGMAKFKTKDLDNSKFQMRFNSVVTEEAEKSYIRNNELYGHGNHTPALANTRGEIFVGHTRYEICHSHGFLLQVIIMDVTDEEAWRLSLSSNTSSTDINVYEQLAAIVRLIEFGDEQEEVQELMNFDSNRSSTLYRIAELTRSGNLSIENLQELEANYSSLREVVKLRNDNINPLEKSAKIIHGALLTKVNKELTSSLFIRYCKAVSDLPYLSKMIAELDKDTYDRISTKLESEAKDKVKGAYVEVYENTVDELFRSICDIKLEPPKLNVLQIKKYKEEFDNVRTFDKKLEFLEEKIEIEKDLWELRIIIQSKAEEHLKEMSIEHEMYKADMTHIAKYKSMKAETKEELQGMNKLVDSTWNEYFEKYLKPCEKRPVKPRCRHILHTKCSTKGEHSDRSHFFNCTECSKSFFIVDQFTTDDMEGLVKKISRAEELAKEILEQEKGGKDALSQYQELTKLLKPVKGEEFCNKLIQCRVGDCQVKHECELEKEHLLSIDVSYCNKNKDYFNSKTKKPEIEVEVPEQEQLEPEVEEIGEPKKISDKPQCPRCNERPINTKGKFCYPCTQALEHSCWAGDKCTNNLEYSLLNEMEEEVGKTCFVHLPEILSNKELHVVCSTCGFYIDYQNVDTKSFNPCSNCNQQLDTKNKQEKKQCFLCQTNDVLDNLEEINDGFAHPDCIETQKEYDAVFSDKEPICPKGGVGCQAGFCPHAFSGEVLSIEDKSEESVSIESKKQIDWSTERLEIRNIRSPDANQLFYTEVSFNPDTLFFRVHFKTGSVEGHFNVDHPTIGKFITSFWKSRSNSLARTDNPGIELTKGTINDWKKEIEAISKSFWIVKNQEEADDALSEFQEYVKQGWGEIIAHDKRTVVVRTVDDKILVCQSSESVYKQKRNFEVTHSYKVCPDDKQQES